MFCPQCGVTQTDDIKFCKACGVSLDAVRQAVVTREQDIPFDWSRTWVAEMFMSHNERRRRSEEIERQRGITPEVKRYTEIKGGVITSFVGIGISIFLYFLMQGIILSGQNSPGDNQILARIWIAGVIPFLIGLGLIVNGVFVSKRMHQAHARELDRREGKTLGGASFGDRSLPAANTAEFEKPTFSVTESTTRHLGGKGY